MRATSNMDFESYRITEKPVESPQDSAHLSAAQGHFSNWALATTGGFLTHVDHDANGAATWVSVGSGAKIWTLLTPRTQDEEELIRHLQTVAMYPTETHPAAFHENFHFSSLVLRPGALL